MIVLGAWVLWKHRNKCVFDGSSPSIISIIWQAEEEWASWEAAGAKGACFCDCSRAGTLRAFCSVLLVVVVLMDSFIHSCYWPP